MARNHPIHGEEWARLRFSIVGPLLSSPPPRGELRKTIEQLARRRYRHPTRPDEMIFFGASTIESWYYQALNAEDPIAALKRKVRSDAGQRWAMRPQLRAALKQQYRDHMGWSYALHHDNLVALVESQPELGGMPSYSTVRRVMRDNGWYRKRRRKRTKGMQVAAEHLEQWEVRSFESEYVHGLWHTDFHRGHRNVVDSRGNWATPHMMALLDDRSRACCHALWYLGETSEFLIHGMDQGFHKRGLPRGLMSDRGSAMLAHETQNGLLRLGIVHEPTLPYSPYQNGKQECFWSAVEGRLMAMLERVEPLTLSFLNQATQAWVELEYNREVHSELGVSPLSRLLEGPDVSRPAPSTEELRFAFTASETRAQRRSDGTISLAGVRFEVPSRLRHLRRLHVRYQSWDLSQAYLVDERTGDLLTRIFPLDKARNADGFRRALPSTDEEPSATDAESGDPLPPLMRKLLSDYAATGLPPAYLPTEDINKEGDE